MEFWKDKKVFITGHTGFKGATLCRCLLTLGAKVTGYALEPPTQPNLFTLDKLEGESNLKSIRGDVRDFNHLQAAIKEAKPEMVFHMAAQPIVSESYKTPVYTYETNVMGTVNILEAIRIYCNDFSNGMKHTAHEDKFLRSIINVTTDKVYLNEEVENMAFSEDDKLCGSDPYSNSKSCSELVTYSYINSFFQYEGAPAISTVRSGNVIGYGDFAKDRIIPDCIRAAEKGENVIVRSPNSIRPYQHVLDCISGYLLLAEKQYEDKSKYAGSYNFGADAENCVTTGELVSIFNKYWQVSESQKLIPTPHETSKFNEADFLKLDCTKAKEKLKWRPTMTLEQAVEKTIKEHKANV